MHSILEICKYLDIKTNFLVSSTIQKDNLLKGQEKIIAICKALNVKTYINAIGGQDLYQRGRFQKEGMELFFIQSEKITYKQKNSEFHPNLSIIDVMMFNSPEQISILLNKYKLINQNAGMI